MTDTPDETALSSAGAPGQSEKPVVRRGRPEHTVLSILVMFALSAAALYGVAWSVQVPETVVAAWDFTTTPYEETPWRFPEMRLSQDNGGVTYLTPVTGPGPKLRLEVDTAKVRTIRATLEVRRFRDNKKIPFTLEWYWASTSDIASAGDGWPFSVERGMEMEMPNRHYAGTRIARATRHHKWTGRIVQAFIGVKFPEDEEGPFQVRVIRIEFLE